MKISIGIIGFPNVGKSTLFHSLTKKQVDIANYPFTTINPNVGVVPMPDERLEQVARVMGSKEIHPAVFEFVDIAGLVKGAHQGAGLGNQFLAHIREVDAIIHLVRVFKDENVVHFEGELDPLRDIETILSELKLKDESSREEVNLLSTKPQIIVFNGQILPPEVKARIEARSSVSLMRPSSPYLVIDLAQGISEADLKNIFHDFLKLLDLITFFTANQNEARSWFVKEGTKAPAAAGVVHTDFEQKFIKAEVINWKKLIEAVGPSINSGQSPWAIAKHQGWIRLEGKDYEVQEGDVIEVRYG